MQDKHSASSRLERVLTEKIRKV